MQSFFSSSFFLPLLFPRQTPFVHNKIFYISVVPVGWMTSYITSTTSTGSQAAGRKSSDQQWSHRATHDLSILVPRRHQAGAWHLHGLGKDPCPILGPSSKCMDCTICNPRPRWHSGSVSHPCSSLTHRGMGSEAIYRFQLVSVWFRCLQAQFDQFNSPSNWFTTVTDGFQVLQDCFSCCAGRFIRYNLSFVVGSRLFHTDSRPFSFGSRHFLTNPVKCKFGSFFSGFVHGVVKPGLGPTYQTQSRIWLIWNPSIFSSIMEDKSYSTGGRMRQ